MHSDWIPKPDIFLKQMARCSYGNLSSSSLDMKMLNRWSKNVLSLLWLSLPHFYSSSNNKLICPHRGTGQAKVVLILYWQELAKTICLSLHCKKQSPPVTLPEKTEARLRVSVSCDKWSSRCLKPCRTCIHFVFLPCSQRCKFCSGILCTNVTTMTIKLTVTAVVIAANS